MKLIKARPNGSGECTCPICLGEHLDEAMTVTVCRHSFHAFCLEKWRQVGNGADCPVCRTVLHPPLIPQPSPDFTFDQSDFAAMVSGEGIMIDPPRSTTEWRGAVVQFAVDEPRSMYPTLVHSSHNIGQYSDISIWNRIRPLLLPLSPTIHEQAVGRAIRHTPSSPSLASRLERHDELYAELAPHFGVQLAQTRHEELNQHRRRLRLRSPIYAEATDEVLASQTQPVFLPLHLRHLQPPVFGEPQINVAYRRLLEFVGDDGRGDVQPHPADLRIVPDSNPSCSSARREVRTSDDSSIPTASSCIWTNSMGVAFHHGATVHRTRSTPEPPTNTQIGRR